MVDELIGLIMEKKGKKTRLFVMSDHGFGPYNFSLNINGWLANLGLLHVKGGENRLKTLVKAVVPMKVRKAVRKINTRRVTINERKEGEDIDYKKSKAYFGGASVQGIYLRVEGDEYVKIRNFIKEELLKFEDPLSGDKLIDKIFFKEEIYTGGNLSFAPDILFIAKGYSVPGTSSTDRKNLICSNENEPLGFHHQNGILIALCEDFKRGFRVKKSAIIDLAPTILYSMGIPVPSDMDGRVLKEIFEEHYLQDHPICFSQANEWMDNKEKEVYSHDDQIVIEKRLRELGYLD
jgi:predicted AlkP superfamily phosphohydrolase/phosphomutase